MTTAKEELWKSLEHLTDEYFKQFKWFLKQDDDDSSAIPASQLERADRQDTVDLMVQTYGPTKAWEVTMKVLEKINRNDLVLNLKGKLNSLNVKIIYYIHTHTQLAAL